jgi:hypothetical protein
VENDEDGGGGCDDFCFSQRTKKPSDPKSFGKSVELRSIHILMLAAPPTRTATTLGRVYMLSDNAAGHHEWLRMLLQYDPSADANDVKEAKGQSRF